MSGFITVKRACEILGVVPNYVHTLIKEQKVIGQCMEDCNRWQVDSDSLELYRISDLYKQDMALINNSHSMTIKDAVENIEELFEGDVITYIMSQGIIEPNDALHINSLLSTCKASWPGSDGKKFKKIILVLHSSGGILEAAIKIVGIIKTYAEKFEVIVPLAAKSAASIISLKADTLYLTPVSELGPVDPMVQSPSNPSLRVPAHVIEQFINHYGSQLQHEQKTRFDELIIEKLNNTIDPYLLGAYKDAQDFAESELCECFNAYGFTQEQLDGLKDLFLKKKSHAYPILYSHLEAFGIGTMIKEPSMLNSVNMIMAIFNNYMTSQNIVKVIGNRDLNHNVSMPSAQTKQKSLSND